MAWVWDEAGLDLLLSQIKRMHFIWLTQGCPQFWTPRFTVPFYCNICGTIWMFHERKNSLRSLGTKSHSFISIKEKKMVSRGATVGQNQKYCSMNIYASKYFTRTFKNPIWPSYSLNCQLWGGGWGTQNFITEFENSVSRPVFHR